MTTSLELSLLSIWTYFGVIAAHIYQVLAIRKLGIYCTDDGRISIAGLNHQNVGTVAAAIHAATSHWDWDCTIQILHTISGLFQSGLSVVTLWPNIVMICYRKIVYRTLLLSLGYTVDLTLLWMTTSTALKDEFKHYKHFLICLQYRLNFFMYVVFNLHRKQVYNWGRFFEI